MYERVWEGTAPGLDGAEWSLFLDFNQDTGLFRVGGSLDGEHREMWECADPVVSGLMARSETDRPADPDIMAFIPPAPLEMQGRFAPSPPLTRSSRAHGAPHGIGRRRERMRRSVNSSREDISSPVRPTVTIPAG